MEEKLSRKERKRLRLIEEELIIWGIIGLTETHELQWKKSHDTWAHSDFYFAFAPNNSKIRIQCIDDENYRRLGIFLDQAHESVQRTRKNKREFDLMLITIKEQICEKEKEAFKQPEEDTTMILPFSPGEAEEKKPPVVPSSCKELKEFIESLKQI